MCQVGDYGCYLKMDSCADVLRAQALLLKVFMMIGGRSCTEYIRALTASIMLWGHYESTQHPCWELFRHNASAFNEESGEISLSALARDISRGGVRSDCEKVSKTFKLVKAKAEVAEDIGIDLAGDDFGSEASGRSVKVDCPEVQATTAFFRTVIRHVLAERWQHYDKDCGQLGKGVRTARPTVGMQAFTACFRSVAADVDPAISKLKGGTEAFWVAPHKDIWPAAVPAIDFASDASDVEVAEEAEEEEAADEEELQLQPQPQGKKRKAEDASGGGEAKKKVKQDSDAQLVGCVVAVPAWKFGRRWAAHHYQDPEQAVLIGDIKWFHAKKRADPFDCAMREDEGFTLELNRTEVLKFRLEGNAAATAKDTPVKR